jgi:hypothetical protein
VPIVLCRLVKADSATPPLIVLQSGTRSPRACGATLRVSFLPYAFLRAVYCCGVGHFACSLVRALSWLRSCILFLCTARALGLRFGRRNGWCGERLCVLVASAVFARRSRGVFIRFPLAVCSPASRTFSGWPSLFGGKRKPETSDLFAKDAWFRV